MRNLIAPATLFTITLLLGCSAEISDDSLQESGREQVTAYDDASNDLSRDGLDRRMETDELRSDEVLVQQDVRKMMAAVYASDVDTVLSFTHPKIIELMGGKDRARSTLRTAFSQIESRNMKLESLVFPEAPTFLNTDMNRFVVVPTKSVVSARGQRVESVNFQFGIQANGTKAWKYVEGSRINQQNVGSLFPDFPSDFEFPEFHRKRL